jgi:hypothetical protein
MNSLKKHNLIIPSNQKWLLSDKGIWYILTYGEKSSISLVYLLIYKARYVLALFVCILAIFRVVFFYFKQFLFTSTEEDCFKRSSLVLDSGRGYGTDNIYNKLGIKPDEVVKIHLFEISSFMKFDKVAFFPLLGNTIKSIINFYEILSLDLPKEVVLLILKKGVSNVSIFSYLKSFFKEFNNRSSDCTVYTDAGTLQSHASISAGIKTICAYHGLIGKNNLNALPEYDSIYVFSEDEKEYLLNLGVRSKIHTYPVTRLDSMKNVVIFFLPLDVNALDLMSGIEETIKLFKSFSYEIYIKQHPLANSTEKLKKEYKITPANWKELLNIHKVNYLNTSGGGASTFINKLKPSFIVSRWGSTVFAEALNMGIIPISISQSDNKHIIYPFHKKSLLWPKDKDIITNILSDKESYNDIMNALK